MPVYVLGNFLIYCAINAFTPGPGNILALNTVTNYGWKKGKPLFFGIFTGYYAVQIICAFVFRDCHCYHRHHCHRDMDCRRAVDPEVLSEILSGYQYCFGSFFNRVRIQHPSVKSSLIISLLILRKKGINEEQENDVFKPFPCSFGVEHMGFEPTTF